MHSEAGRMEPFVSLRALIRNTFFTLGLEYRTMVKSATISPPLQPLATFSTSFSPLILLPVSSTCPLLFQLALLLLYFNPVSPPFRITLAPPPLTHTLYIYHLVFFTTLFFYFIVRCPVLKTKSSHCK